MIAVTSRGGGGAWDSNQRVVALAWPTLQERPPPTRYRRRLPAGRSPIEQ